MEVGAKIRYRQPDQPAVIESYCKDTKTLHITFPMAQRAVTLRQSIVFYCDKGGERICLGGGMIAKRGETYFERNKALPDDLELNKSPN